MVEIVQYSTYYFPLNLFTASKGSYLYSFIYIFTERPKEKQMTELRLRASNKLLLQVKHKMDDSISN